MGSLRARLAAAPVLPEVLVLASFLILSLTISWPLAALFTTSVPPGDDVRHNISVLWHVREWAVGRQPLFDLPLLYFPYGASLLTHGLGPVTGIFALPFWPWGGAAAHNGAVLVSLTLTGWCMYLLARDIGLERGAAVFAGAMLLTAPMCLAGIYGHMTKVFLGGLPLTVLMVRRALDPERSIWWVLGAAAGLLLMLLHAGYQFVAGALLAGIVILLHLAAPERGDRRTALRRVAAVALASAALVGPLIVAIQLKAATVTFAEMADNPNRYSPDLVHLLFPPHFSRLLGPAVVGSLTPYGIDFTLETTIWLSWVPLALGAWALFQRGSGAWRWALMLAVFVALSLGPVLKVLDRWPLLELGVPMPYSLVTALPGLSFMRVPGRFMMAGFVALAVLGGLGLALLMRRAPTLRLPLLALALGAHLLLIWPAPWPHEPMLPTPEFYKQLASDPETFGVFDLPYQGMGEPRLTGWTYIAFAARAQIHQTIHGKGIAAGYLSRNYDRHPVFPHLMSGADPRAPDLLVDGVVANGLANAEADLARFGYRYVVVHHQIKPEPNVDPDHALAHSATFVEAVFGSRPPLIRDAIADVYAVDPAAPFTTTVGLLHNWYGRPDTPDAWRWAISPAELYVAAPVRTPAMLELLPSLIHDPASPAGLGQAGRLRVDDGLRVAEVPIRVGEYARVPVVLPAGTSSLTLTLAAANFRPTDFGGTDPSVYSFALNRVHLLTAASFGAEPDLLIAGRQQLEAGPGHALALDGGWYDRDGAGWRWADARAALLIYSEAGGDETLRMLIGARYDRAAGGLGDGPGEVSYRVGDASPRTATVRPGDWVALPLSLQPGWNRIALEHLDGAFRPSESDPASGDTRSLSFAALAIELVPGRNAVAKP